VVATDAGRRYALRTGSAAHREDLLDQIRALPVEDRDYIEAALMREAYDRGRHGESQDELAEIVRRAERDWLFARRISRSRVRCCRSDPFAQAVRDFRVEAVA